MSEVTREEATSPELLRGNGLVVRGKKPILAKANFGQSNFGQSIFGQHFWCLGEARVGGPHPEKVARRPRRVGPRRVGPRRVVPRGYMLLRPMQFRPTLLRPIVS